MRDMLGEIMTMSQREQAQEHAQACMNKELQGMLIEKNFYRTLRDSATAASVWAVFSRRFCLASEKVRCCFRSTHLLFLPTHGGIQAGWQIAIRYDRCARIFKSAICIAAIL